MQLTFTECGRHTLCKLCFIHTLIFNALLVVLQFRCFERVNTFSFTLYTCLVVPSLLKMSINYTQFRCVYEYYQNHSRHSKTHNVLLSKEIEFEHEVSSIVQQPSGHNSCIASELSLIELRPFWEFHPY